MYQNLCEKTEKTVLQKIFISKPTIVTPPSMSTMKTKISTMRVTCIRTTKITVEIEPFCPLKLIKHFLDNRNIVDLFA